ncbi:hypothetical protein N7532_004750 [Penicillium argentinense]|uniref:Uncharacterized protein n=1 Tax=Penicillium argentinense TaxID=1131581 RepID=A0A9W9KFU1_9EURO|nr:uncharacterized protein N7532_004750 [Penicillium argentinense]KAJ5104221.1 hypothetical protein N7532_004750 [Penicillium argentinense]
MPVFTNMRSHPTSRRCARSLWILSNPRLPLPFTRLQSSSSGNSPSAKPQHNARSHRRRRERVPKSRLVELEVDALGERGNVTLLTPERRPRSFQRRPSSHGKPTAADSTPQTTIESLLNDLDQEEASALSTTAAQEAIRDLGRTPEQGLRLTTNEWEGLRSQLASSFTYNQLTEYIANNATGLERELGEDAWRPGMSSFWHASPAGESRGTGRIISTSQGLTGKSVLAERILRDCWQLSVTNEQGQLDLRLSPAIITVLHNSTHFSFDEVADLHHASIDITNSLGLVRVTGTQEACEWTREVIQDAVARIREETVGISLDQESSSGQAYTPPFLEWVCKKHGIAIEQSPSSVPEKILYLAENLQGAEDARRTFHLVLSDASQSPVPFSTYMPASKLANMYDQSLRFPSWFDRQKSWSRWATSSAQKTAAGIHPAPFFDDHQTRISDEILKLLRKDVTAQERPSNGATVYESVTAAVGRCLFSPKNPFPDADGTDALSASQLGRLSLPRTFTREIPKLTPFLEKLPQLDVMKSTGRYLLRLKPSFQFLGVVPELEVEFAPRESNAESSEGTEPAVKITSLRSILRSSSVDYLLPEISIDLRFTRTAYRDISAETLSQTPHYKQLVQHIEDILGRLIASADASYKAVPLPAFCTISLPRGLLLNPEQESFDDALWDALPQNNMEVEYIYPPLCNIHDAVVQHYYFDGRKLSYQFYESGSFLAANTTDVSLAEDIPQPDPKQLDSDEFQRSVEQQYHSFYLSACDLAFKVHLARHNSLASLLS